jgi:hypothetical protein
MHYTLYSSALTTSQIKKEENLKDRNNFNITEESLASTEGRGMLSNLSHYYIWEKLLEINFAISFGLRGGRPGLDSRQGARFFCSP